MNIFYGIDPGLTGAICAMREDLLVIDIMDMPCLDKELDAGAFMDFILSWPTVHVFMEKAQAMPKNGVVAMFNYGRLFGEIVGVLKAKEIPYTLVTPQRWKKIELKDMPAGKESSVIRVNQLYPELRLRKTQHGRSDAVLIARYGIKSP